MPVAPTLRLKSRFWRSAPGVLKKWRARPARYRLGKRGPGTAAGPAREPGVAWRCELTQGTRVIGDGQSHKGKIDNPVGAPNGAPRRRRRHVEHMPRHRAGVGSKRESLTQHKRHKSQLHSIFRLGLCDCNSAQAHIFAKGVHFEHSSRGSEIIHRMANESRQFCPRWRRLREGLPGIEAENCLHPQGAQWWQELGPKRISAPGRQGSDLEQCFKMGSRHKESARNTSLELLQEDQNELQTATT